MKIAIGSLRKPKIEAVKDTIEKIRKHLIQNQEMIEYLFREVESNISPMPLTISELMQGAYNRVLNLIAEFKYSENPPNFYVGLEGGFNKQIDPAGKSLYFLQGWVYVSDGIAGHFGGSGAIPVPDKVINEVVMNKNELGDIIDQFGNENNIRDKFGAFGVFTKGYLTRKASFELALLSAFAPFFNQRLYQS